MKTQVVATAAFAAVRVYAQSTYPVTTVSSLSTVSSVTTVSSLSTVSPSPIVTAQSAGASTVTASYTTITYSDCPSITPAPLITVTDPVTVTYCPECESMSGYTTVYTTTYLAMCPTGTTQSVYTVTESCPGATPTWTPGPNHIPQGYTTTVYPCTNCGMTTAVTITEPCDCSANEGTSIGPATLTPAPTPTSTVMGPAPQSPAPNSAVSSPMAPYSSTTAARYPISTGSVIQSAGGNPTGTPTPVPEYNAGTPVVSLGMFGSLSSAAIIAALAFAL